jgi:hypothetical protein
MQRLHRILAYSAIGVLTGVLIWGAIVRGILYLLDQQHGEGFAHIPSPFLGWLSFIIGGMNGAVIGLVLGFFRAGKILKGALLGAVATLGIILGYYFVIDPGISLLISSSSVRALKNLAVVAIILSSPSPVIGIVITFAGTKIFRWFEAAGTRSLSDYPRSDAKELVKTENRAD